MKGSNTQKATQKVYFEGIFNELSDELFRFAITKVRDRESAIDMVQDAFHKLWQYLQAGTELQNPRALLYKIIRNKIIDSYRGEKFNVSLDDQETLASVESNELLFLDHEASSQFDAQSVIELLNELPAHIKDILIMRYVDDLSINEIANFLEVTPNTISIKIHRAITELKSIIEKKYGKIS